MLRCRICNCRLFLLGRNKVLDGAICSDCIRDLGLPELVDIPGNPRQNFADVASNFRNVIASAVPAMAQDILDGKVFSSWYSVGSYAQFDDRRREALLSGEWGGNPFAKLTKTISYDGIIDYQLLEDGGVARRGELSGAFAGGMLFDSWEGAWLGGMAGSYDQAFCRYINVEVYTKDAGTVCIRLLPGKVNCDSSAYRRAVEDTNRLIWKLESVIGAH